MVQTQRLIVGLGNPEKKYEYTRHNLGFLVVQNLAEKLAVKFQLSSFTKGRITQTQINDHKVWLLLPLTYMNNSGDAVKQTLIKKQVELKDTLIICDDLNLEFGTMRLRSRGSDGGHNGLTSIIENLETDQLVRLRIGIGQPRNREEIVDYVLGEFTKAEKAQLPDLVEKASECCLSWIKEGTSKAMETFNRR